MIDLIRVERRGKVTESDKRDAKSSAKSSASVIRDQTQEKMGTKPTNVLVDYSSRPN